MILPNVGSGAPVAHAPHGPAPKAPKSGFAEELEAQLHGDSKSHKKKDGKAGKTPPPAAKKDPEHAFAQHAAVPLPELRAAPKKHEAHARTEPSKGPASKSSPAEAHEAGKPAAELIERPKAAELAKGATPPPATEPARATIAPLEPVRAVKAPLPPPELELPHDPALSVALMPRAAHLAFRSDELGDVHLHLRVRDGVADVRIDAAQAGLFAPREAELRTVLAGQGLSLGSFDLPQRQAGEGALPERDRTNSSDAPAALARASHSATRPAARHAGRIDVEA